MLDHRRPMQLLEPAKSVTAIINGYKRAENVDNIILSLLNQSVPLFEIHIWWNDKSEAKKSLLAHHCISNVCSRNLGVWARFAYALNTNSDYIVIFDDDTIPGHRWIENCLLHSHLGLLGTIGLIYRNRIRYMDHNRYGWANPNPIPVKVDIVGHSWFFQRDWLSAYFAELKPTTGFELFGEDIHFSYILQKYLGIATYVPPHPPDCWQLWGSINGLLGEDQHAISMHPNAASKWDIPFSHYLNKGFKLLSDDF